MRIGVFACSTSTLPRSVAFSDRCLCDFRGEVGDEPLGSDENDLRDRGPEDGDDGDDVEVEVVESERSELVLDCRFEGHRSLMPLLDSWRWWGEELVLPILNYFFFFSLSSG
jgi:hypothetical protein